MDDGRKKNLQKAGAIAVAALFVVAGVVYILGIEPEAKGYQYDPSIALPEEYVVFVDEPDTPEDRAFVASLSSLVVRGETYHPFFILGEEGLDQHMIWTLQHHARKDAPKLYFTHNVEAASGLQSQMEAEGIGASEFYAYTPDPARVGDFKGFSGVIQVETFKEAVWVSALAKHQNKGIIIGKSTYPTQDQVWLEMSRAGIPPEYLVVVNTADYAVGSYRTYEFEDSKTFTEWDEYFHIPKLSLMAPFLAAYRDGYVLTDYLADTDAGDLFEANDEVFDRELNARAIGLYKTILGWVSLYGIPEYVAIVGSAAAVPQFQLMDTTDPDTHEADGLVNGDVLYGFTDADERYMMLSAVGRLINLNVQGLSNQLVRTFTYDDIVQDITVEYTDGDRTIDWRNYGSAFSGYQITYQRRQATPARFVCQDYDDESMEYEYYGPSGVGSHSLIGGLLGSQVVSSSERDLEPILEASSMVAYRGHGSYHGSLYMIPYMAGDEKAVLRSEEAALLDLPPQVAQFVSCENAKIHGGSWTSEEPVDVTRTFAINYLYGGAVGYCGATEVSFSNPGQDTDAAIGEVHPDGNHKWDNNDAWFAFFWDGLLNHEEDHGTVVKAVQWSENRYMHNPNHDFVSSPFVNTPEDSDWYSTKGLHWKEVTMFACYGDPAFAPHMSSPGPNDYDPWHNGDGEGEGLP
jgi:hypothetical protein